MGRTKAGQRQEKKGESMARGFLVVSERENRAGRANR